MGDDYLPYVKPITRAEREAAYAGAAVMGLHVVVVQPTVNQKTLCTVAHESRIRSSAQIPPRVRVLV
jgi:hypothetical protein